MTVRSADVSAVYELLYNKNYTPERSPHAHIEEMTIEGELTFILMKEAGEYFEVDKATSIIWDLLDGKKTVRQITDEVTKSDDSLTEKDVRDAVVSLAEEGCISSTEPEVEEKRIELVSAFQLDVRVLRDSSKTLAGFFKITRRLARRWELFVVLAVVLVGAILTSGNVLQILSNPTRLKIFGSTLVGLLFYQVIVLLPVYLIHELSHAAACDYYGGKPKELGTGLYYFAPFFYCDTSDSWRLSRRARIMISIAGPLSTMVAGSFFAISSLFLSPGFGRNVLEVGAFFCFYGTLTNFSPVIETDGYYVLSDVLKIPNLRDETFSFIKRILLKIIRRPVAKVSYTSKQKRIFSIYSLGSVAWLLLFGYTTLRLTYFYSLDARRALLNLANMLANFHTLSLATVAVSLGALFYFSFLILGYLIMGSVAYKKIRIRGVKLETIHDKRVSIFLPLPSTFQSEGAMELVRSARALSRKLTRSFSVTWEPPLCVAALKLGKIEQSLDQMKQDMMSLEKNFKSLHHRFVSKNLQRLTEGNLGGKRMEELLKGLANHFPSFERKEAVKDNQKFLKRQETLIEYVLFSAFGTIWSIELSPEDYKRLRLEMFQSLVTEDLTIADSNGELERFKKHTILGLDALSKLSSEMDVETRQVKDRPELYQATVFIEPVSSRLLFVGRTEGIERSIVWLGGLFLYQAWTGYMKEALYEVALGLKSIRLQSTFFGSEQFQELSNAEIRELHQHVKQLEQLQTIAEKALTRIRGAYQSAKNFQESITLQLEEQSFDVGFYRPILRTNEAHLANLKERIDNFQGEQSKVFEQLTKRVSAIKEEYTKRAEERRTLLSNLVQNITGKTDGRKYTPAYRTEIRTIFAMTRLLYPVICASDVVI